MRAGRGSPAKGGNSRTHHDAANYAGKKWDPQNCAGPSDKPKDCGGKPLKYWDRQEGTVYAEPGIQIYEDPDPQGSPVGPYPLPAFYIGTCGVVVGGGPMRVPFVASAGATQQGVWTNKAGQLVVSTGC